MLRRHPAPRTLTDQEREACEVLAPFMRAGMKGMRRSRWRVDLPVEHLVAPIVLAVLVEVAKQIPLAEMTAALDQPKEKS